MKYFTIILATLLLTTTGKSADEQKQIVDLRGSWKFEIGDNKKYSDAKFDDSKWGEIFVPDVWEDEGYAGYDGYAWYRKKFVLPASAQGKNLYYHAGYIDDASEVYLNGHLIGGKGLFPPEFETAYDQEGIFMIPKEFLKFNQENIVAIRVYDDFKYGGITRGKVGIFSHSDELEFAVKLPVLWKFNTGDNMQWAEPGFNDSQWEDLIVPLPWDHQGYADYDGFGWYRITIDVPANLQNEKLILMLGKIDDIDEAYLNGEKIGNTGKFRSNGKVGTIRDEYQQIRAYRIPTTLVRYGQKNVLAVRVFDNMRYGGICEGPIGIMTEKKYREWSPDHMPRYNNAPGTWWQMLDKIFNN